MAGVQRHLHRMARNEFHDWLVKEWQARAKAAGKPRRFSVLDFWLTKKGDHPATRVLMPASPDYGDVQHAAKELLTLARKKAEEIGQKHGVQAGYEPDGSSRHFFVFRPKPRRRRVGG